METSKDSSIVSLSEISIDPTKQTTFPVSKIQQLSSVEEIVWDVIVDVESSVGLLIATIKKTATAITIKKIKNKKIKIYAFFFM